MHLLNWDEKQKGGPQAGPPLLGCEKYYWTEVVASAGGVTLTTRRPRLVPNSTCPATKANSVSSPPRPTPSPGWKWVPRWRTMISPAFTCCPPKRLTPSRWALESRPFRLDDAPFLCAILTASAFDPGDLHLGITLTVALTLPVARLVLVLEDTDLRSLCFGKHFGGHRGRSEVGDSRGDPVAVYQQERLQANV